MSLAEDLLAQAEHLATLEKLVPPLQVSLRRSVSTAYYALFHCVAGCAATACCPETPPQLRLRVQRALDHGSLTDACNRIVSARVPGAVYAQLLPELPRHSAELRQIAELFVLLQEERHSADYDLQRQFARAEVLQLVTEARQAFDIWRTIQGSAEANIFLADCCFGKRWGR